MPELISHCHEINLNQISTESNIRLIYINLEFCLHR